MRATLNSLCLFLWLLPALSAAATKSLGLQGVRGARALQAGAPVPPPQKKCKKYKEPAPKVSIARDGGEAKQGPVDPKAAAAAPVDPKATPPAPVDPKATPPAPADPRATAAGPVDPKATAAGPVAPKATPPAPVAPKAATPPPPPVERSDSLPLEQECLEWESADDRNDSGGTGDISTEEFADIKVDCDAIANDKGPKSTDSLSFEVNIDVLKKSSVNLKSVLQELDSVLQSNVAPTLAACNGSSASSSSTKIVNVDFGSLVFDQQGCDSSLAKGAADKGGVCVTGDVPLDVYFVGDVPNDMKVKIQQAIAEHDFSDLDGVMAVSEDVKVVQTGSKITGTNGHSSGSSKSGGLPIGAIIGVVAALAVVGAVACLLFRKRGSSDDAKREPDTDEDLSDDDKVPVAQAIAINDGK